MQNFLLIIFFCYTLSFARQQIFIAPDGSDANPGTEDKPLRNIQTGIDRAGPGDTVLVKNGQYTQYNHAGSTLQFHQSGEPGAWITLKAFPGHRPKIVSPTWNGIVMRDGLGYIEINGFEIQGVPHSMSDSSGHGLHAFDCHHIRVLNNIIHDCPGGGIGANGGDYMHIEGNTVFNNCYYSGYQNSGISLYQNTNVDEKPGYHNIIRGNCCYGNENRVLPMWGGDKVTDGNGIIIDDSRHTQGGGTVPAYTGWTLVENNVIFGNGGRGIHAYLSDNVMVVNNTLYRNQRSKDISDGELTAIKSGAISFYNNIVFTGPNGRGNKVYQGTDCEFDYNLYHNVLTVLPAGPHDIRGVDPLFVSQSLDAGIADFHLQAGSPAIDAGTATHAAELDFDHRPRPLGAGVDMGAYEYPGTSGVENMEKSVTSLGILRNYPNPFNSRTVVPFSLARPQHIEITVYNTLGQPVKQLFYGFCTAGHHKVYWNATDSHGAGVAGGIYYAVARAKTDGKSVRKLLYLK